MLKEHIDSYQTLYNRYAERVYDNIFCSIFFLKRMFVSKSNFKVCMTHSDVSISLLQTHSEVLI